MANNDFETLTESLQRSWNNITQNFTSVTEKINQSNDLLINNPKEFFYNTFVKPLGDYNKDKKIITLYYRNTIPGTRVNNTTSFEEDMNGTILGGKLIYGGFQSNLMCDSTFQIGNKTLCSRLGYSTSAGSNEFPPLYIKELVIDVNDEFGSEIHAHITYLDSGIRFTESATYISNIDSTSYVVTSASGIFEGATHVNVKFNNTDKTRICKVFFYNYY